jgi:hypothetical protein
VPGGVDVGDRLGGYGTLRGRRAEDLGAVAGADDALAEIRPVDLEEVLEQLAVGEALRVEDDLDRLGVPVVSVLSGTVFRQ